MEMSGIASLWDGAIPPGSATSAPSTTAATSTKQRLSAPVYLHVDSSCSSSRTATEGRQVNARVSADRPETTSTRSTFNGMCATNVSCLLACSA
jgi:hypothetical protein